MILKIPKKEQIDTTWCQRQTSQGLGGTTKEKNAILNRWPRYGPPGPPDTIFSGISDKPKETCRAILQEKPCSWTDLWKDTKHEVSNPAAGDGTHGNAIVREDLSSKRGRSALPLEAPEGTQTIPSGARRVRDGPLEALTFFSTLLHCHNRRESILQEAVPRLVGWMDVWDSDPEVQHWNR